MLRMGGAGGGVRLLSLELSGLNQAAAVDRLQAFGEQQAEVNDPAARTDQRDSDVANKRNKDSGFRDDARLPGAR